MTTDNAKKLQLISILNAIRAQMHDWAIKEPDCVLAYVNIAQGEPDHLLNGPPAGPFLRQDRHLMAKIRGRDKKRDRDYFENKLLFGTEAAADAFAQLACQLDNFVFSTLRNSEATNWYDYLFEFIAKHGGSPNGETPLTPPQAWFSVPIGSRMGLLMGSSSSRRGTRLLVC